METKKKVFKKSYANRWIALSSDRKKILAAGKDLKEVVSKAKTKNAIFFKPFPMDSYYIPTGF
jgi:hypothetical protein